MVLHLLSGCLAEPPSLCPTTYHSMHYPCPPAKRGCELESSEADQVFPEGPILSGHRQMTWGFFKSISCSKTFRGSLLSPR